MDFKNFSYERNAGLFLESAGFFVGRAGVLRSSNDEFNNGFSYYPDLGWDEIYVISRYVSNWLMPRDFFVFCVDRYTPIIKDEVEVMSVILGGRLIF